MSCPVCFCLCLHLPAMFRPSVAPSHRPLPERTSGTFPGSISVVYRDKVMTALWPQFELGICFQPRLLTLRITQTGVPEREALLMDLLEKVISIILIPSVIIYLSHPVMCYIFMKYPKKVEWEGREVKILREAKGTGAYRCSENNRKLVISIWSAYQHGQ